MAFSGWVDTVKDLLDAIASLVETEVWDELSMVKELS
jgi:hypothetical protein